MTPPRKSNRKHPSPPGTSRYHVPNLERALLVMEFLGRHPRGLGFAEIANGLQLPKNSIFRITMTLLNHGYLSRDPDTKRFVLSRKLLALGYTAIHEQNLIERALDVMRDLRNLTTETVILGALLGNEGVALEQVPALHQFRFMVDPGSRFRLHTSAPGKVLLAFLPESEREQIIEHLTLTRFNERTLTKKDDLRRELRKAGERGYAVDRAEEFEGVHCVAAPIFNQHHYPVASIWTTGPSYRMPQKKFAVIGRQVKEHAALISRRLGYGLLDVKSPG